jgi:hypothetical protein
MKFFYLTLLVAACICGCSAPEDETAAEAALRHEIDGQSQGNMKLVSFTKTNGQSMSAGGMEIRQIDYAAEIEFEQSGTWRSGGWPGRLVYYFTTEIHTPQSSLDAMASAIDSPIIVHAQGRAQIQGKMAGTKKDNGWQFQTSESSLVTPIVSN